MFMKSVITFLSLMVCYLSLSSSLFIIQWVALEMLMILTLAAMKLDENIYSSKETIAEFFFIQSTASLFSLYLFILMNFSPSNMEVQKSNSFFFLALFSFLSLKMGLVPFHVWLMNMSKQFSWFSLLVFLTWNKVVMINILISLQFSLAQHWVLLMAMMVLASINPTFTFFKQMLALSSSLNFILVIIISHLSSINFLIKIFSIYAISITLTITLMMKMNLSSMTLALNKSMPNISQIMIFIALINMASLPPSLLFTQKILTLEKSFFQGDWLTFSLSMMFMALSYSLVFTYLRVFMVKPTLLSPKEKNSWFNQSLTISLFNMSAILMISVILVTSILSSS